MTKRLVDTRRIVETRQGKHAKHNLFETPNFFADVYVLAPGQVQKVHHHQVEDKCYFVLSGRGVVTVGDDRLDVEEGQIVHCPAGSPHGVENAEDAEDDLRMLVFMAPHPRQGGVG